jgi:membrane fusion protein, multidrug efflux system
LRRVVVWRPTAAIFCSGLSLFMSSAPLSVRRWILYVTVALGFAATVWYFGFRAEPVRRTSSSFRRSSSTPTPVRAVTAERQELAVHLRAIGTVTPLNTVTVRSRVEGELIRLTFEEGQRVEQGQLLAEIDSIPYQIRLTQMEAEMRQNAAQLLTVRNDLERLRQLHAQTLVSQQQLETQQALVAQREAALAADQSRVDDARRQLAYTRIEAPIAGRLGLRRVDPGNLVRSNDTTGLVTISQTQPIAVMFTVPEIDLLKVIEPIRAGEELAVEALDRNEQRVLGRGRLRTVDNQIDLATGTLRLKAEFPNEDERLFPNQFVNVRLRVRTVKDAIVIPTAAVQFGSRGTYVFLVNEQSQATVRDVVLGPADGQRQSTAKGLVVGDRVVLEGVDRLREGRTVLQVGEGAPPAGNAKAGPPTAPKGAGAEPDKSRGQGGTRKAKDKTE